MLKRELDMDINKTTFWTDSMSVLRYIRNFTSRFHTFVANRLSVIHEGSKPYEWRYVNTKLNLADVASRGLPVDQRQWKNGWIEAPSFLLQNEDKWPSTPEDVGRIDADDPEAKAIVAICTDTKQESSDVGSVADISRSDCIEQLINHYSSWYKLKRSIAWILKIRDELRRRAGRKISPTLKDENLNKITPSDLKKTEIVVVSYVQRQTFNKEIEDLKRDHTHVKRDSYIRKLDLTLENNVLRVGGRRNKSSMPAEQKHPAILPKWTAFNDISFASSSRRSRACR
ncbi:uncharacterized protein LOC127849124 [Dreissena polymorpha]|uniref:uncharacterized protein LOC127849124 n=1 Tax=Dreissena polymorpha TaxID=45954 RepID=UPI002263D82B|nr:uncharacterized protein LOC127849124 [Dreissena polymorpha]